MLEDDGLETEAGLEQGDDLNTSDQPIDMRQWDFAGSFPTVNGEVANLGLQTERNGVIGAQFDAATGGPFDRGDDAAADQGLEGIGCHVPGRCPQKDRAEEEKQQEIFPPLATSGPGTHIGHWPCPPGNVGGLEAATGVRILLPARRLCSQEENNWFTFSWVRISRIFPATCARGTSWAPARRNWGRSLSR